MWAARIESNETSFYQEGKNLNYYTAAANGTAIIFNILVIPKMSNKIHTLSQTPASLWSSHYDLSQWSYREND